MILGIVLYPCHAASIRQSQVWQIALVNASPIMPVPWCRRYAVPSNVRKCPLDFVAMNHVVRSWVQFILRPGLFGRIFFLAW